MSSITDEQRKRIQANKERALALRKKAKSTSQTANGHHNTAVVKSIPVTATRPSTMNISSSVESLKTFQFLKPNVSINSSSSFYKNALKKKEVVKSSFAEGKEKKVEKLVPKISTVICTLRLISIERFEVVAIYHNPLIELCKSMSSRIYGPVFLNILYLIKIILIIFSYSNIIELYNDIY